MLLGMVAAIAVFHTAAVLLMVLLWRDLLPRRWYAGLMEGLHNTIGITTPDARQVRWVMLVWIASVVVIVDAMAFLVLYVF